MEPNPPQDQDQETVTETVTVTETETFQVPSQSQSQPDQPSAPSEQPSDGSENAPAPAETELQTASDPSSNDSAPTVNNGDVDGYQTATENPSQHPGDVSNLSGRDQAAASSDNGGVSTVYDQSASSDANPAQQ